MSLHVIIFLLYTTDEDTCMSVEINYSTTCIVIMEVNIGTAIFHSYLDLRRPDKDDSLTPLFLSKSLVGTSDFLPVSRCRVNINCAMDIVM